MATRNFPRLLVAAAAAGAFLVPATSAWAHHTWPGTMAVPAQASGASTTAAPQAPGVTGQGRYKFKVFLRSDVLPQIAKDVLIKAHGGFAVDHRKGKGEAYWSLPGAGILQVSGDMKSVRLLKTPANVAETTLHNATIWYGKGGDPFLVFPGVDVAQVFTTNLDGRLLHTLHTPRGDEFGVPAVNDYFRGAGNFVPTDVEYLQGVYYVATGYSRLDYVLTARVTGTKPFKAEWHDLAFGGRGTAPGQFGTGHGITIRPDGKQIAVADRPNAEIDHFTRHGQYLGTMAAPMGSLPCDIDYLGDYALVPALDGPDRKKGAPIYLYEKNELVSTIVAREDLGLENFTHVHNAVLRQVNGKLYILAQAWNPGDFAIFEQITD